MRVPPAWLNVETFVAADLDDRKPVRAPSLRSMRCMWFFTVCSERFSRLAISLLVSPC